MDTTQPVSRVSVSLTVRELRHYIAGWELDGEIRAFTPRTMEERRAFTRRVLWYVETYECASFGAMEIRAFLAHAARAHEEPGGRWGNPKCRKPLSPRSLQLLFGNLQAFFNWVVDEADLPASPMGKLKKPLNQPDQIQPFSPKQVEALLNAARVSLYPKRNEALLLFMLDTGARASEVIGLKVQDVDILLRTCRVLGKGHKERQLYFGRRTAKALWSHIQATGLDEGPLFTGRRGHRMGEALTRNGLYQLVRDLGQAAGIQGVRCSPHTMRHTHAVSFIRNGGNSYSLQENLGHTSQTMTARYVKLAEADVESQHRRFSPVDNMPRSGTGLHRPRGPRADK